MSRKLVTSDIQTVLQKTLAEILGLAQGYCRGRGGSMHLQWFEAGALGTNAIVGGGAPMATGNAWAQKRAGTSDLTINYFGDGAAQPCRGGIGIEPPAIEAADHESLQI